jgi:multidrug efflux pump subunit AcrA (membrane-fusion protein)
LIKNAISEVSFVPKNGSATSTQAFYKATVNLSNKERVLRPGMRLNAQIRISKVKDALSINSMAFQVDADILKKIAEKINFTCIVLDKKQKKEFRRSNQQKGVRFVWVKEGSGFVEKGIVVGITDEAYWQVVSGLSATDKVIVDVQEPNVMDEMYSKWFKGSL